MLEASANQDILILVITVAWLYLYDGGVVLILVVVYKYTEGHLLGCLRTAIIAGLI